MVRVMISLPDDLVYRMRAFIPTGERSRIIATFLEKEILNREEELYKNALELESNGSLTAEMKLLDEQFCQDGLDHV